MSSHSKGSSSDDQDVIDRKRVTETTKSKTIKRRAASSASRGRSAKPPLPDKPCAVNLQWLLDELLLDQWISVEDHQRALTAAEESIEALPHPVTYIASFGFLDAREGSVTLNEHLLTYWMSQRTGIGLVERGKIGSLNHEVLTSVMSMDFAKQHQIVAVDHQKDFLVVATTQPFLNEWLSELEHSLNKSVTRVLAEPSDIERFFETCQKTADKTLKSTSTKSSATGNTTESIAVDEVSQAVKKVVKKSGKKVSANTRKKPLPDDSSKALNQTASSQKASQTHRPQKKEKSLTQKEDVTTAAVTKTSAKVATRPSVKPTTTKSTATKSTATKEAEIKEAVIKETQKSVNTALSKTTASKSMQPLQKNTNRFDSVNSQVSIEKQTTLSQLHEWVNKAKRMTHVPRQWAAPLLEAVLMHGFQQRASDIHIEPRREHTVIRYRIDGLLHNEMEWPVMVSRAFIKHLKVLARLEQSSQVMNQQGRMKTLSPDGAEVELRISVVHTAYGEKLVMSYFDPDVLLKKYSELGFSEDEEQAWVDLVSQPQGLVLVTGPKSSGKTTTIYSTLKQLANEHVNICTIENPIDFVEPAFNQTQVQPAVGVDYAAGLSALMVQDPDMIFVGEILDEQTAKTAVQAALSGYLVFSSIPAMDAPSAITYLLDLGIPAHLIRTTLRGVLSQRLIRTLCPHCKRPGELDEKAWNDITQPWKASIPEKTCQPSGCPQCRHTGFIGREGIYEMMTVTGGVAALITDDMDLERVRKKAIKDGMRTLRLSGAQKVASGLTTIEEVMRVSLI